MGKRTCGAEGCDRPHEARGWCSMHYKRWQAHGDPLISGRLVGSVEERFWHYVDKRGPDECWPWNGTIRANGYGQIWIGDGATAAAHIIGYRVAGKTAEDGLQLDHTCHDPAICTPGPSCPHRRCCNPDHLEPVTAHVNTLRSGSMSGANARKEFCSRAGHPYDEANTAWRLRTYKSGAVRWARYCRACAREQQSTPEQRSRKRAWYQARKQRQMTDQSVA